MCSSNQMNVNVNQLSCFRYALRFAFAMSR